MPIYMDVHILPGVRSKDVAQAHYKDLLHQEEYACKCMTYWVDEERGNVFCLIEAPTKEAVTEMHGKAHGLVPNKVIEVSPEVVSSFLGRIYDPESAVTNEDGLKEFADPSYRVILLVRMDDPLLLQSRLGNDKAADMLSRYKEVTRRHLAANAGSEVECGGTDFIISFSSASKAVSCALAIQQELQQTADAYGLRIAINGGEPVENSNQLFGDTIQLAGNMCAVAGDMQIVMPASVKELVAKDHFLNKSNQLMVLSGADENLLRSLFSKLEANWQNAEFDMEDYCKEMAMSNSQLYRKTIQLVGSSRVDLQACKLEYSIVSPK